LESALIEDLYSPEYLKERQKAPAEQVPEARYAYYRRCQIFRKGGEQCKAPAETGALICHAHAGQLATAVRRERERKLVLEEAVAEMRRRGKPDFEAKDLFMDFKGIQVTAAKMAQAVIDGRIDCKTAGRLVVELQTFSKLLWMMHRAGREERKGNQILPQICADERRERTSTTRTLTTKDTKEHKELPELFELPSVPEVKTGRIGAANEREETLIAFKAKVLAFPNRSGWPHGPPGWTRAA
jgi:hypothetical protein